MNQDTYDEIAALLNMAPWEASQAELREYFAGNMLRIANRSTNHWFKEANKEHNENERLKQRIEKLEAELAKFYVGEPECPRRGR